MRFLNNAVINNLDLSVTRASSAIDASNLFSTSAQFIVSGVTTATGNMKLQASNDPVNPTNWNDITVTALAGNGAYMISKTELCYRWIRYAFISTAADSGAKITCNAQAVGV